MIETCLIIPCYNEAQRLPVDDYRSFLHSNEKVNLCFVNDGSRDNTSNIIKGLQSEFLSKVLLLDFQENSGKAEAVRRGINHCLKEMKLKYLGFLDAELSAPLKEYENLKDHFVDDIEFAFGSRIMKIGSVIERSAARHYIGRVIATFISNILDLKVYDTQCGCKLFKAETASFLFQEPFLSRWLFDVELFARMIMRYGHKGSLSKMVEVPLNIWINKGGSKVSATYFFRLWWDLYKIKRKYFG